MHFTFLMMWETSSRELVLVEFPSIHCTVCILRVSSNWLNLWCWHLDWTCIVTHFSLIDWLDLNLDQEDFFWKYLLSLLGSTVQYLERRNDFHWNLSHVEAWFIDAKKISDTNKFFINWKNSCCKPMDHTMPSYPQSEQVCQTSG